MSAPLKRPTDGRPSPAMSPMDRPRLWPNLDPARRRQLAQWLAVLSRRLHNPSSNRPEESSHESA